MANTRNGNTIYVDATGDVVTAKSVKLVYVILTPTAASGRIVLTDITTTATKLDLREPTSGLSHEVDLSKCPVIFPNGINVGTLTNAVATLVVEDIKG